MNLDNISKGYNVSYDQLRGKNPVHNYLSAGEDWVMFCSRQFCCELVGVVRFLTDQFIVTGVCTVLLTSRPQLVLCCLSDNESMISIAVLGWTKYLQWMLYPQD